MKTEVYDTPVESDETLRSFGAVSERERLARDIDRLKRKMNKTRKEIYANLTPWQRVQIARHLDRPHSLDYISMIFSEWNEVHGDRLFSDDPAMVTGYAFLDGQPVAIIGQQKGANTRENVQRNFGMSHPEGYRKALRIMKVANKFHRPIIIFVDTPGAYPGIGSEERGVAEAIARNMKEMFAIEVPIIICVIGEGASGGAIGIGVGDTILMMENAWYTVISPEGCASILWRDAKFAPQSAEALKLTAKDLLGLEVIDDIIPEPEGGAHQNRQQAADNVKAALLRHLKHLRKIPTDELLKGRFQKFRKMGKFIEG
ncbi:MAG: acetyl-CoA carboxylase carboxyltransferase subunit alpha [Candidatus Sumerlaeota bacterium]|nr:acetyl-CoA carboxylase carboxyltransferase subunit alpha [Candidatus Sumerlaeota bacterium]